MFDIELPSKKDVNIPVPQSTEIKDSAYNENIAKLQKSFKETAELLSVLMDGNASIGESTNQEQDDYTESLIFDSWCNGPIFEKVYESNKNEISRIAAKIRRKLNDPHLSIIDAIKGRTQIHNNATNPIGAIFDTWILSPRIITWFNNDNLRLYAWQTVAFCAPPNDQSLKKTLAQLNDYFKDDLKDKYEIDFVKMRFLLGGYGKKRELTEDERENTSGGFKTFLTPFILIIKNKGTKASNKDERDIQVNLDAKAVSKLKTLKTSIMSLKDKVKGKFGKNKSMKESGEDFSLDIDDTFEESSISDDAIDFDDFEL